jgi:hypothetical protein
MPSKRCFRLFHVVPAGRFLLFLYARRFSLTDKCLSVYLGRGLGVCFMGIGMDWINAIDFVVLPLAAVYGAAWFLYCAAPFFLRAFERMVWR